MGQLIWFSLTFSPPGLTFRIFFSWHQRQYSIFVFWYYSNFFLNVWASCEKPDELVHHKSIDKNRIDFRNTNEQNHCAYQILQKTPLFISRREKSKQQQKPREENLKCSFLCAFPLHLKKYACMSFIIVLNIHKYIFCSMYRCWISLAKWLNSWENTAHHVASTKRNLWRQPYI